MSDQLAVARLQVARTHPYYASILWAFQFTPVADFAKKAAGPIGVDKGLRLYYDPVAIVKYPPKELATIMVHEIGHVVRAHATRQGWRDAVGITPDGVPVQIWNLAGDCEINDDLAAEGLELPGNCILPKTFKFPDNLMAEEYYDLLMNDLKGKPKIGCACGSVAGGPRDEHEAPSDGTATTPAGVSEAEQELMRMKVAQDVEAHAKTRGNVPAWLQRWAKDKLRSKVDWRRKLAARIRSDVASAKGMTDYSYQRPGRRSGAQPDFVWPCMRQPTPRVHIQIDTSGSMSEKELAQAIAEVEGVLRTMRVDLTVTAVDAAVHTTQKIFRATDVKLMGGGGTDMTLGLLAAEAMRPRPHVIICITDCETGWPPRPLRVPLIVARTSKGSPAPSWASVVDVVPDVA